MAFCKNCGRQVGDDVRFCPACGTAIEGTADGAYSSPNNGGNNGGQSTGNQWNVGSNNTYYDDRSDVAQNKVFAILGYIGVLVLVPILAAPNSRFARFHANQSLINIILCVAYSIAQGIFMAIITALLIGIAPAFVSILRWCLNAVELAFLAFMIIGIVNAANGEMKPLPVIGNLFTLLK